MRPERRRVRLAAGAIEPHALHGEHGVARVELDGLTARHLAQIERGKTARQPELEKILLLIVETDLGALGGAYERARAHLELDVAVGAGIENVTGRQRCVDLRRRP